MLHVVSDLHLQHPIHPFLFTPEKEAVFVRIAAEVLASSGTLLLAGDVLDLTGMTPPAHGLATFLTKYDCPAAPVITDVTAQVAALRATFPRFFEVLGQLARDERLWLMPGNHDCAIAADPGRAAFASALGVASADLVMERTFREGDCVFALHGNDFDPSNQTAHGCANRGAVIAGVLYHALVPALRRLGVPPRVVDAVPSVRPEENVVDGIALYLGEERTRALLRDFVRLLQDNGYFTGLAAVETWMMEHVPLMDHLITPARVRAALADDNNLSAVVRKHAEAMLAGREPTAPPGPPPAVVVMGHTHELDATQRYVNLGTWIDHVRGLGHDDMIQVDRTLPVLVVDGDRATLHDCSGMTGRVADCRILWSHAGAGKERASRPGATP